MGTALIRVEVGERVARIRFVHPPLHVIDLAMAGEILSALKDIEGRAAISTIVFEGDEKAFSAGVSVQAHLPEQVNEMLRDFHAVIRAIVASRKVTIAVVQGVCLGGGAELAAVCDMVYSARDAVWGFPEIKLGCYPPVATVVLPALVGARRASELILTGRQISGDEAAAIGLVTRSVRAEELAAVVEETLKELRVLSHSS